MFETGRQIEVLYADLHLLGLHARIDIEIGELADASERIQRFLLDLAQRLGPSFGHGIAYKAWLDVAGDVRERRLVLALSEYAGETVSLTAIVPDRRSASPTVRTLITHLKVQIAHLPALPTDRKKDA